jgi:hypothetical protein
MTLENMGSQEPACDTPPLDCFGLQMSWMMEDSLADPLEMRKCHSCADFDRCSKISTVRALLQIKFEMRRSTRGLRDSLGGSHSQSPFW